MNPETPASATRAEARRATAIANAFHSSEARAHYLANPSAGVAFGALAIGATFDFVGAPGTVTFWERCRKVSARKYRDLRGTTHHVGSLNARVYHVGEYDTDIARHVRAFEILEHGVDHAQYFQGCGTSFTEYTDVATGAGDNATEAYRDAVEQLAQMGYDVATLPSRPKGITKRSRVPAEARRAEDSEIWYYVSVRVR